jgi:hypothetical protein
MSSLAEVSISLLASIKFPSFFEDKGANLAVDEKAVDFST